MFRNRAWSKTGMVGAALVLLIAVLLLGPVAPAWTSPLQHPYRQTMPLTPPATWTPVVQGGEVVATPELRPTALPTRASNQGGAPSGGLGGSAGGSQPAAKPIAWLELTSDTTSVAPAQEIVVRVLWANLGDGALEATAIQLMLIGDLELVSTTATMGRAAQGDAGTLTWSAAALAPGQEAACTIVLRTSAGLWPGTEMLLEAQAAPAAAEIVSAALPLNAPAAILPLAGRS